MKKQEKKSYAYKPAYGIVVMCTDEANQIELFTKLKALGLTLKVVVI